MFGISFSELFVIAIVALLVIGPEKLPKVARTIGALTGRMQRYATQVKEEVNREFRFEELQKLQQEIKQAVVNTEQNIHQHVNQIEHSIADFDRNKTESEPDLHSSSDIILDSNLTDDKAPTENQTQSQKPVAARKPRAKSAELESLKLQINDSAVISETLAPKTSGDKKAKSFIETKPVKKTNEVEL